MYSVDKHLPGCINLRCIFHLLILDREKRQVLAGVLRFSERRSQNKINIIKYCDPFMSMPLYFIFTIFKILRFLIK